MPQSATAVDTGTDYGNVGSPALSSPTVTAGVEPQPEASAQPGTMSSPSSAPAATAAADPTTGSNPDAYNPLAAQPYSAPAPVPVTPLQPAASALGPDQQANGAVNKAGAAAYGVDQLLRGYMKGVAVRQANQAVQLQKQTLGLHQNLDEAQQQLYSFARAGMDPNSSQFQDAQNRVTAAWQAQMDFMKQHVAGEQIDKKTGQLKPQQGSILSRMTGQDPAAVPLATYQAAQRLGPPVMHAITPFLTPQYQTYAKTQAQTAGVTAQGQLESAKQNLEQQQLESRYNQLSSITGRDLTPDEDQERSNLAIRLGKAGAGLALAKDQLAQGILANPNLSPEDKTKQLMLLSSRSAAGMFLKQPQLGTKGFLQAQYAQANGIDPTKLTPQDITYLDSVDSWAKIHPQTTSQQHLVPGEDAQGRAGMIPMTTYSTKGMPGAPQPPPGRKSVDEIGALPAPGAESAVSNPIVSPSAPPSAGVAAAQAHQQALQMGGSPTAAQAAARAAARRVQNSYLGGSAVATADKNPPGFIPTGKPHQQTADETKAYNNQNDLGTNLKAAQDAANLPDKQAGDRALVLSFAKSHIGGKVSNMEVQNFNNMGSAQMKFEGNAYQIVNGTMSPRQRKMMLDNMQVSYNAAKNLADNYRKRTPGVGQNTGASAPTGGAAAGTNPKDPAGIL